MSLDVGGPTKQIGHSTREHHKYGSGTQISQRFKRAQTNTIQKIYVSTQIAFSIRFNILVLYLCELIV